MTVLLVCSAVISIQNQDFSPVIILFWFCFNLWSAFYLFSLEALANDVCNDYSWVDNRDLLWKDASDVYLYGFQLLTQALALSDFDISWNFGGRNLENASIRLGLRVDWTAIMVKHNPCVYLISQHLHHFTPIHRSETRKKLSFSTANPFAVMILNPSQGSRMSSPATCSDWLNAGWAHGCLLHKSRACLGCSFRVRCPVRN